MATTNPNTKKWQQLKSEDPTKKRDFQVRVHIIEARDLQPRDSNGMSDPVCIVNCLTKKNATKKYSKTTICTWDHLMFFEFNLLPDEFFLGKIKVGVYDANTILRDVMIGCYEFDVGNIYDLENHELYRRWVALTDTTGKKPGVQGYLKLSVTVLGPEDKAPAHEEDEEQDDEQDGTDLQSLVLLPPSIQTEEHSLELSIYRAEALPKMDTIGKCDGFVTAKFGGNNEIKTEVIKNSYTPTWNEKLIIPVTTPTLTDLIRIQVKDWDAVGKDETVSTFFLKFSEIANSMGPIDWKKPRWVNLYGTPEGVEVDPLSKKGKLAGKMNDGYVDGCAFRGRVLLSAESLRIGGQKLSKHKINVAGDPPAGNYTLRFDLFEAAELRTKAKLAIEVSIGAWRVESKKVSVENGNASFYQALDEIQLSLPKDKEQIPDIFIDIMKHPTSGLGKKKRIGFVRIKASEINNNAPARWEIIQPDIFREADEDNETVTGFLQFKMQLGMENEIPKQREPITKPKMKKYQLRANIYQGRELPAADANGLSDPYIVVRVGKYSAKTKIIKKTLFPLWYETLSINMELPENLNQAADINISVWDWDQLDGDDYLGRFSIPITSISEKLPPQPTWNKIYKKNPKICEGEILASFQLIPEEKLASVPMVTDITPSYKNCVVEVSVIGLRNLLPFRLLSISKAYIEVDCGGETILKTKISSQPTGSSPNFLEILPLEVKLPASRLFAPPLNIRVFDDRVLYKALVATRSISLAPFIQWSDDPIKNDEITKVNVTLEDTEDNNDNINLHVVSTIPGAKADDDKPVQVEEIKIVPLEDNESSELMSETEQDMKNVKDKLTQFIDTTVASKIPESYLPGAEAEPEEKKTERKVVKSELEIEMGDPTFQVYKLYRTKKQQGRRIKVEVGTFKGRIRVFEKSEQNKVEPPLDLNKLYAPADYVVRAYILEGFQLVPKDSDGSNNPYMRIKCGKNKIKDLNEAKQGTSRPQFFKCYELPISFPATSTLDLSVWDYDRIGSDDLIGNTTIDLENRIFSNEWKNYSLKPTEYRTLWNPSSSNPQGQLRLFIDILTPDEARSKPIENIAPPQPRQYELRVIIWETRNVVFKDKNMSDIFVVGYPEGPGQKPQTTDTHWRSEDHTGKFNWRMKFPIILPNKTPRFKLQIWDKDLLNPNDAIAEANLNLRSFYNRMYKNKNETENIEQQWVVMTHPAFPGVQGEVLVSFELLTMEEAKRKPAGFGRKEPNDNPHLPEPVRPETSFNPLRLDKMISKVVWGQNKGKIIGGIGICVCLILLVVILGILVNFNLL